MAQATEEPSIKRAKGGGSSEADNSAAELTAHDLLVQVANVQLAAAQKEEHKHTTDNDLERVGSSVFAGPGGTGAIGSGGSSASSSGAPPAAGEEKKSG